MYVVELRDHSDVIKFFVSYVTKDEATLIFTSLYNKLRDLQNEDEEREIFSFNLYTDIKYFPKNFRHDVNVYSDADVVRHRGLWVDSYEEDYPLISSLYSSIVDEVTSL